MTRPVNRFTAELTVYTANLRRTHFTIRELAACIYSRHFFALLAMFVALMVVSDPVMLRGVVPFEGLILFWLGISLLYLSLLLLVLTLIAALSTIWTSLVVYLPLIGVVNVLICSFVGDILVTYLRDGTFALGFRPANEMIAYFVVAQIFETLYFLFVYPLIRIDYRDSDLHLHPERRLSVVEALAGREAAPSEVGAAEDDDAEEAEAPARLIHVAGVAIAPGTIRWIRAEEHFVRIRHDSNTEFLRARLQDVVAQLPPDLGYRLHRSYWVARDAITRIASESGVLEVTTNDGETFTVAQTRRRDFLDWAQTAGLTVGNSGRPA